MSLMLTFHDDLWRVSVAGAGLPDGRMAVERSTNGNVWTPVRGSRRRPVDGGALAVDDYEYQPQATNHYRLRPVDPPAGLLLAGVSGDYASTPDHASLDVTGDQTLVGWAHTDDWTAGTVTLAARYVESGDNRAVQLRLVDGVPQLVWSTDGAGGLSFISALDGDSNVLPLPADSGDLALASVLDVDNGNSEHEVSFWTAPGLDGPWTQWGVTRVLSGITSVASVTAPLEAGSRNGGTSQLWVGRMYGVQYWDGRAFNGGTLVADARFDQQTGGSTQFDDTQGRTWTVHGAAYLHGIEQDSIVPPHDRIVLKSVEYPAFNRPVTVVDWTTPRRRGRQGIHEVKGRPQPIAVHDIAASPTFGLELMTDTAEQERVLDLLLAQGGVLLLHVPPDCPVPGGYIVATDTTGPRRETRSARTSRRYWDLSCRVVAAPDADVQTALVTWHTLHSVYGDWPSVWAAHASWLDVWGSVEDPSEVLPL